MQTDQEVISTLIDGELGAATETTLGHIAATNSDRDCWARYHLIGDVLRDRLMTVATPQFSTQLRDRIAQEPSVLAPRRRRRSFVRPIAGLALAASVAALAVIGVRQMTPGTASPAQDIAVATPVEAPQLEIAALQDDTASRLPSATESNRSAIYSQRRLNGYLVKFNAQRSSLGVPGVNPHVRMIGFGTQ